MKNTPTDPAADELPEEFSEQSKQQIKQVLNDVHFKEKVKKELRTMPKYQEYFAQFNPTSIEHFITGYANTKYLYMTYADMYQREAESEVLGYQPNAEKALWYIQQKKLFDLQCRWRANQIQLPGVETTWDFGKWESNIRNCPFLEPITEEEVDLYIRFLETNEDTSEDDWHEWQNYEEITASYREDEEDTSSIPEWYQFYNLYKGTASLMLLPDLRGKKEEFYRSLWRKKQNHQNSATNQPSVTTPTPPSLDSFDEEQVEDFMKACESRKDLERYRNYRLFNRINEGYEEVEAALEVLLRAKVPVPIAAHDDWRQAILAAARRYENLQTARAMTGVYEDYRFKLQMGLGYEDEIPEHFVYLCAHIKEQIIEGRLINGEPGDLNF